MIYMKMKATRIPVTIDLYDNKDNCIGYFETSLQKIQGELDISSLRCGDRYLLTEQEAYDLLDRTKYFTINSPVNGVIELLNAIKIDKLIISDLYVPGKDVLLDKEIYSEKLYNKMITEDDNNEK